MNFKAWLITNKIKQYEIAELLGISVQSVNNKVNGRVDFTLSEIKKLNAKYGVAADIFLN
jgi:plasmid maintenance system antidote protein VapI